MILFILFLCAEVRHIPYQTSKRLKPVVAAWQSTNLHPRLGSVAPYQPNYNLIDVILP